MFNMKIHKSKLEKIKRKVAEELTRDSFFSFCLKENPERYNEEFEARVSKEIRIIKDTLKGRKESKKMLQFSLIEDEFSNIKDSWYRKFCTNKKVNKLKNRKIL